MEVRTHRHDMRTHDRGFAVSTPWCKQLVPVEMAVKPHPLIAILLFPYTTLIVILNYLACPPPCNPI
jgi:hypothetical protein